MGTGRGGHGGARHWAMGGEGAAGKHLLLVVGSRAGDLAPLATPWKWESHFTCLYSLPFVSHHNVDVTAVDV